MSELKATPGPWGSEKYWGGGRLLIRKGCIQECLQIVPSEDAHLIAAAPELYEALANIENDDGSIPKTIWDMRNAALAKARGEQP